MTNNNLNQITNQQNSEETQLKVKKLIEKSNQKKGCKSCKNVDAKFFLRWEFIVSLYIVLCGIKENVDIIKYLISLF